jgi:putative sterol carrier protein
MWDHLDTLFVGLNARDSWDKRHGRDWTFADVPYHLAYFNRDLVARALELGPDVPQPEQHLLVTPEDVHAWNFRKFAARPEYQTIARTLCQWYVSCEAIYCHTLRLTDADLERPFWMPIRKGWATVRDGLELCRDHDWSVFTQLRIHMRRIEPLPSPDVTRGYLATWINSLPRSLRKNAINGHQFTAVVAFSDPGVGAWTIRVADGAATTSEGEVAHADLVITQSAETFEKSIRHMHNPIEAILAGKIQVSNFENLSTLGHLFPQFSNYLL